jgi:hypothetical protein
MGVLDQLLTLENVMLCFAIVALVWVQRKGFETFMYKIGKDITKSKVWKEFFTPLGPLGTGMGIMLLPGVPIPAMFAASMASKAIFGIGLGLVSGLLFRLVKKMIFDRAGKQDEEVEFLEE